MELILSAISAGGLVGASNQYACLFILGLAARFNIITITPSVSFMSDTWFLILIAFFWLLTTAPAFASFLSPGVMNVIHTVTNFVSGFIVPLSSALLALAAIGVIADMHPSLVQFFESMKLFNLDGSLGITSYVVGGVSGAAAATLTGAKALTKPVVGIKTGTTATVDAPLFTILENAASVILMVLAYLLTRINPWLLVVLFGIIILSIIGLIIFTIRQLKKFKKGIGRVIDLVQHQPKNGWSVIAEFFIWGSGWFIQGSISRGILMFLVFGLWLTCMIVLQPLFVTLFGFMPILMPFAAGLSLTILIILYIFIGLLSSRSLISQIDQRISTEA